MADSDFKVFREVMNQSTRQAAISTYKEIQKLHKNIDKENADFKALGRLLDGAAVLAMRGVFETQPHFSIEIKGSEGRKDTRRDGIESPDLYGSYGPKDKATVEIVNDAVEGTAFASRNIPGSYSILAAALNQKNGLTQTGNFDYMSKLFGPPALSGKLSLELSPGENIKIALRDLNINDPRDLSVVILDRPRNQFEIKSAYSLGVNVILINGGDLIPALLAVQDPRILKTIKKGKIPTNTKAVLLMGSGGWEEGIIATAAARATQGHAQARVYSEDTELVEQAKVLEASDLVPADPGSILISATAITYDPWFNVPGVTSQLGATTVVITKEGVSINES